MAGLNEILLALVLTGGGHEMGHINEADRLGVPVSFKNMELVAENENPEKSARIANAGIVSQDIMSQASKGSRLEKPTHIISALNKLGYALMPGGIQGGMGDLRLLEKSKGKKARQFAQGALTVSAISDMLRAFGKVKSDKGFSFGQSNNGTPMLVFGGSF